MTLANSIIQEPALKSGRAVRESACAVTDEQRTPRTFNSARFIADETAAKQGHLASGPFTVKKAVGCKPDVRLLAGLGLTPCSTTIPATKDTRKRSHAW